MMFSAHDTVERLRPLAADLVEEQKRITGSLKAAYATVARMLGGSPSWLRHWIGQHQKVNVAGHQTLNVIFHWRERYRRACERERIEAEIELTRLIALKERANEVFEVLGLEVDQTPAVRSLLPEDRPHAS